MDISIPTNDGAIPGHLEVPQEGETEGARWPGVVVVHDLFGLGDDIKAITARFASAGYLALAPDLYSHGRAVRCVPAVFRQLRSGGGRAVTEIEDAGALLRGRADCTGAVGVAGFCMGGGFALLTAPAFDASAPYYGFLPSDPAVLDAACAVVASFGGKDFTLRGAAGRLTDTLARRGVPHDVKEYPTAGHGFANQYSGPLVPLLRVMGFGYRHDAAADAWHRVLQFFGTHLVPDRP